jgi:hypothetical protein
MRASEAKLDGNAFCVIWVIELADKSINRTGVDSKDKESVA